MSIATPSRAAFDVAQELSHTGIGSSFAVIGSPINFAAQALIITSSLDKPVWISTDGTTNNLLVLNATCFPVDVSGNKQAAGRLAFPAGTQFYAKQGPEGAPSSGEISISIIYAR